MNCLVVVTTHQPFIMHHHFWTVGGGPPLCCRPGRPKQNSETGSDVALRASQVGKSRIQFGTAHVVDGWVMALGREQPGVQVRYRVWLPTAKTPFKDYHLRWLVPWCSVYMKGWSCHWVPLCAVQSATQQLKLSACCKL